MTHLPRADRQVLFDVPLEAARDRITVLRSIAPSASPIADPAAVGGRGPLARLRDAIGARLIDLGRAVVADESIRRRAARS